MNRVSLLHQEVKNEKRNTWKGVSIPYESGLTFTRPEGWFRDRRGVYVSIPYESGLTFTRAQALAATGGKQNGFNPLWIGSHFYTLKVGDMVLAINRFNPLWIGSHFYTAGWSEKVRTGFTSVVSIPYESGLTFTPIHYPVTIDIHMLLFQSPMNRVSLLHPLPFQCSPPR